MVQQVLIVVVDSPFFSEKKESRKHSKKPSPGNTHAFSYFIDTEGHSCSTTNGLSKREASTIVSIFFEQMASAFEKGDRVEIRGLCSFYVKEYEGHTVRNPKTGETIRVESKKLLFFKCGKELKCYRALKFEKTEYPPEHKIFKDTKPLERKLTNWKKSMIGIS